ncbi:TPA: phage antirepressor [Clostridioides difficile]|uniref:phage antirepressor n=1 Tax=Clostridioides difficile TaxID=1496 RepID=UPI00097FF190|nr:phage antirepressor KilAC domain-containing protein [Clostridioides difficile]AXU32564.1 antirepressor, phage associated [Clostridioides difficile]AXU36352.1 antirepressor, phage associated [Clostridioides difficile]MDC9392150.1 phage antirepressor KilAC domain-containing protein [Clostridioides difficile]MDK1637281.1 phage antirepressor KilAC domain-containing protein [Clostridioides difficile]MDV9856741.1 phage antirepressor KilAC domain-containing protein [Clostridioides difficile]
MSNLMMFEDKQVEVFEFNGKILFNPYHCGNCLGISNEGVRKAITRMNKNQVIKLNNSIVTDSHTRKLHNTGENFLTESGVYKLIFKSKKEEAEKFQDWVTDEVLPNIRKTGGYIHSTSDMSDDEIMARALQVAQRKIESKNRELEEKNRFINQIASSKNSLLVREVAKVISKSNGIIIGEKRLYEKLRVWGLVFKNSTEPKQFAVEKGYLETVEGTRETSTGVFTYRTTRVTGKGQEYILKRLLKEEEEQLSMLS